MFTSLYILSYTIGSLVNLISVVDSKKSSISERMSRIEHYCREVKLPMNLRNKLRNEIKYD